MPVSGLTGTTLPSSIITSSLTTVGTIITGAWAGTAISPSHGGTSCTSASGTCLDNITGFASTGIMDRTGAGTYSFTAPGTGVLTALAGNVNASGGLVTSLSPTFATAGTMTMPDGGTFTSATFSVSANLLNSGILEATSGLGATSTSTGAFRVTGSGGIGVGGAGWFGTYVATGGVAIASLPSCVAGIEGARMFVTNGVTSPTFLGTVSTTGAVIAPVFCNGSSWVYGQIEPANDNEPLRKVA
jgi:hypothetical protein